MKAYYDNKPAKIEAVGNGSYLYRWNIQQETITFDEPMVIEGEQELQEQHTITRTQWKCDEVTIWGEPTSNSITKKVIDALWGVDYEGKLLNEYNAATMGFIEDASEAAAKMAAYKSFLAQRDAIKAQINADYAELYGQRKNHSASMVRVTGKTEDFALLRKEGERFIICWDYTSIDENNGSWMQAVLSTLPTLSEIKDMITNFYNGVTDNKILSGFTYQGHLVWLSKENQDNYKAAYDLCIQRQGEGVLPLTIKIGTTDNPVYKTFTTIEEFSEFYLSMFLFVQSQINQGWAIKDAVDYEGYEDALRDLATT